MFLTYDRLFPSSSSTTMMFSQACKQPERADHLLHSNICLFPSVTFCYIQFSFISPFFYIQDFVFLLFFTFKILYFSPFLHFFMFKYVTFCCIQTFVFFLLLDFVTFTFFFFTFTLQLFCEWVMVNRLDLCDSGEWGYLYKTLLMWSWWPWWPWWKLPSDESYLMNKVI